MNDEDHAYWSIYTRRIADRLGLKDWEIVLKRDGTDAANSAADMRCVPGRKVVWIRLADVFFSSDPDVQRYFVVHELVHVHLDDIDTVLWKAGDVIEGSGFSLVRKLVDDRVEFAVDAIASVFAPYFPLPGADDA